MRYMRVAGLCDHNVTRKLGEPSVCLLADHRLDCALIGSLDGLGLEGRAATFSPRWRASPCQPKR
jgi:hypothetical protein